eukprot:Skav229776  [mRNA]  locus=scaffold519:85420:85833:+ [translate_table: standard]
MPANALLVKQPWASMIVKGEKTWEIRNFRCEPRRVAIAESGASSPRLLGEVTVTHCVRVGHRVNGQMLPCANPENFIGANVSKHRVDNWMDVVTYDEVWAWVLADPIQYADPKGYERKQGQQVWVNLTGSSKRRRTE